LRDAANRASVQLTRSPFLPEAGIARREYARCADAASGPDRVVEKQALAAGTRLEIRPLDLRAAIGFGHLLKIGVGLEYPAGRLLALWRFSRDYMGDYRVGLGLELADKKVLLAPVTHRSGIGFLGVTRPIRPTIQRTDRE
jgi:hypothetical protein